MQRVKPITPAIAGGPPVRRDYLVFGSPFIGNAEIEELVATVRSGWIGTGPRTAQFEREFASYVGAPHAVAVSSGTAALHLALVALGLGPDAEVVVPSMTFVATANSVIHAGATPVLCDVDPEAQNARVEDIAARLTPRTRAILPVHFAGRPADLTGITALARDRGLLVIGDAAHAIEAAHRGANVAQFGAANAYSFYPTKNVTTGEGGMVTTAGDELAARVRRLRLHGLSADAWSRFHAEGFTHYEALEPGFKANMTDLQAALGLHQLRRIEETAARRSAIWRRYDEAFRALPVTLPPPVKAGDRHAHHLYMLLLNLDALTADRDTIARALHLEGIGVGVHYRAVHLHPYYRERFGFRPESFPHAADLSARTLSLPLSARLTDADADDVVEAVTRVVTYYRR